MLDLEAQIHRVADTAFDQTSPVTIDLEPAPKSHRRGSRLTVMAAVIVAAGGVALLSAVRSGDQAVITGEQDPAAVGVLHRFAYLADPLNLDLDGPIEISPRQRLNSIGPVLVSVAFGVAAAILAESSLSFLGLGQ